MRKATPIAVALVALLTALWSGCGTGPASGFGVKISFAEAGLAESVNTGHVAVFKEAEGVSCATLNPDNYLDSWGKIAEARVADADLPVFKSSGRRALVQSLPAGENLIVYIVGLKFEGDNKVRTAKGCRDGILLTDGKVTAVDVTLEPI